MLEPARGHSHRSDPGGPGARYVRAARPPRCRQSMGSAGYASHSDMHNSYMTLWSFLDSLPGLQLP